MASISKIQSRDNPRVRALTRLRRQRQRHRQGRFVADGLRQVERAIHSGLTLREGFFCADLLRGEDAARLDTLRSQTPEGHWFAVPKTLMHQVAYRAGEQALLGVFDLPAWAIDDGAGDHARRLAVPGAALWLVAVGIEKPGNLGAMVRSADAAGACGIWIADAVVDAFHPNAIEASTAAVFSMPVYRGTSEQVLALMGQQGVSVVAGAPSAERIYTRADMSGPTAIVVGAEDHGLGPIWLDRPPDAKPAVQAVSIPMQGGVSDSLNAAASAAVLLFEAVRQRTFGGATQEV